MSNQSTCIIAEVGQAHDGSLGMLHAYIDALANVGVDAIKFQMHIAEAESSHSEPFRVQFSYQDQTRYDYWQRMSFTLEQWVEVKKHCDEKSVEFMCTPFSVEAVKWLESINTQRYKIGSGDLENYLLLDTIAETKKPILLSSGMADYAMIDQTLAHLAAARERITLMQCTTEYPTPLENVGLNNLSEYQKRFSLPVGLSDHSGTVYPSVFAAYMGAVAVENHVVFDKRMFGPDTKASLTIEDFKTLVDFIRAGECLKTHPVDKTSADKFNDLRTIFGRSLALRTELDAGEKISLKHLECKKPHGLGIDVKNYQSVLGKTLNRKLSASEFLNQEDID